MKEFSVIRAKEANEAACLAETKLMEAEKVYGKVMFVVQASGFQAPSPKPAWTPIVVDIRGGMKKIVSQVHLTCSKNFNSSSFCLYPREWHSRSCFGLNTPAGLDCNFWSPIVISCLSHC
jgi:hypothetical protein